MSSYGNKYRKTSHRWSNWDYASEGMYFITLVTQHRENHLGVIENGTTVLSDWGKIVEDCWLQSFDIRKELFWDEYIIMPNHIYAIVVITAIESDMVGTQYNMIGAHGRAHLQRKRPINIKNNVKWT